MCVCVQLYICLWTTDGRINQFVVGGCMYVCMYVYKCRCAREVYVYAHVYTF